MVTCACEHCGASFSARAAYVKTGRAKHCSRACAGAARSQRAATIRACVQCGKEILSTSAEARRRQYCSRACAMLRRWSDREQGTGYRSITRPDHPLATARGTILEHRVVLYDAIGAGEHPCHWCTLPVVWATGPGVGVLYVDHLDGNKQNNSRSNLVPSCAGCNAKRGMTGLIEETELAVTGLDGRRHRAEERTCKHCGSTFLHRSADRREHVGRFCSRSCAAKYRYPKHLGSAVKARRGDGDL